MDGEKPFKTIEVVDSRTNQVCKVACMSCIRGHRTTSCGIPVCRTKVFWTVKRPGRPSNSCTCRFGATGGCKCVVATAACPHKSKKGGKRSGECRCDELGRYCCLIEPEHWAVLFSLRKPTVDFFPSREALEMKQAAADQASFSLLSGHASVTSLFSTKSIPNTPVPQGSAESAPTPPYDYNGYQSSMSSPLTPRFGMMGIGAPMGSQHYSADVLAWQGQAPIAPRDFNPSFGQGQSERDSCCAASAPSLQNVQPAPPQREHNYPQSHDILLSQSHTGVPKTAGMAPLPPAPFDLDKLRTEYLQHQFPNSICQNCGLSGCTCRNCPPVFQNFGTTSWAQCCGRKHARDVQPLSTSQKVSRTEMYNPTEGLRRQDTSKHTSLSNAFTDTDRLQQHDDQFGNGFQPVVLSSPSTSSEYPDFHFASDMHPKPSFADGADPLDLMDFLVSELDQSQQNLMSNAVVVDEAGGEQGQGGGEDGRDCCCGGP